MTNDGKRSWQPPLDKMDNGKCRYRYRGIPFIIVLNLLHQSLTDILTAPQNCPLSRIVFIIIIYSISMLYGYCVSPLSVGLTLFRYENL